MRLKINRRIVVLLLIDLIVGIGFTFWVADLTETQMRSELLVQARICAKALDARDLAALTGLPEDIQKPAYQEIKSMLAAMRTAHPKCKFLYLMGRRADGSVFFQVDSLPPDSPDYAPPGLVYEEISGDYLHAFRKRQETVVGPVTDRWGTLVTALIPITSPHTDGLLAVLGMDIQADDWYYEILIRSFIPFLAMLLFAALILFTERKRGEEKLRKNEENLRITLNSIGDGVISTDTKGHVVRMNPVAQQLTGWPLDEARGKPLSDIFHIIDPRTRQPDEDPIRQVMETGKATAIGEHSLLIAKDGSEFQIADSVAPILDRENRMSGIVLIFRDVTEEYRMKNAIREREERLRHIAAHIPGVVYQLRVSENGDMRMVYVSERAVDIFGLTDDPETFLDAFINGIHEADRPSFLTSIQAAVSGRTPWDFEGRFVKADEGIIWFSGTATPARRDDHLYFHGILMDITRRKAAEEELKKMDKLKSIGTLAGGIAHDFNNILAGVFGNISLARLHLESGHPSAGYLEKAEDSMQRATHLTGQLLTFSRGGHPVREAVRLEELVADTVRFDLSGSRVKPEFTFAPDLWPAKVDMGQIQQVFSNLTINAVQAMPDGGHLHIELENAEIASRTPFELAPGRYIKATISDDGPGIDQEYVNRIFDPYFTTKQTGSGLGLATVHSIVSKHGGHIQASSQPGRGTTFTLYLPASDDDQLHQGEAAGTGERIDTSDIHILVMDDEAMVRDIAREMLEKNGCRVQTASDGEMAIEMYGDAMAKGDPFDLVIMDLTVPGGLGGDAAIKRLREMDPQVKAIVSSGYADDALRANDADYSVKAVVYKPYTMDRLMDAVHRALAQ